MVLVGVDVAVRATDAAVGSYAGAGAELILLTGPPGSGKTSLIEDALGRHDYVVHRATAGESTTRETARAQAFCQTAHSVDVMLAGTRQRRRAVLLDNCLADAKSICTVFDALKKMSARVLVIGALGRSIKAPDVRRRASAIIPVPYPSRRAAVALLRDLFAKEAKLETYRRCAEAAEGCIPKAVQLVRGELYGTRAEESLKGVDTTMFDDVARGIDYCLQGRPFDDIDVAISSEPSMSAMIIRESVPRPLPATRAAYRALSKTPPGSWYGTISSTVAFCETALSERAALDGATLKFPRCYTTTSSRVSNTKKRLSAARLL